ncbi:MAG: hypothetical protein ABR915_19350, partial [Thermoguttaceae bacterium]
MTLLVLAMIAASPLAMGQDNRATMASPDDEMAASSLRQPPFTQANFFAEPAPGAAAEKAEPEQPPDLSDLGAMAGGAAGTGAALPTLQGDTTWGGRPAYPHVIAPALVATPTGLPTLNDSVDKVVFSGIMENTGYAVDSNSLPTSLKSADLVMGLFGWPTSANANAYLPFSAMLLSSPIIGYDMINWAENGCILPQDRVFFDYRHFDAVGSVEIVNLHAPDPANGHPNLYYQQQEYIPLSVDRYVVGFEKTFDGGLWSLEARLPFQYQAE